MSEETPAVWVGPGRPVVGFDTETTGTNVRADRIVTAAVVVREADGWTTVRRWLLNVGVPIPPAATAIHGVTDAQARRGQNASAGLAEIADVLAGCLARRVPVLACNATFDLTILEADLARHGLPGLAERLGHELAPVIDPLVIDRGCDRYRRGSRKLPDLMAVYGADGGDDWHDAAADVVAAIRVFDGIAARYPQIGAMDDAALHAWQREQHGEWARHYNEWLASRGRTPTADESWPVSPVR